MGWRGPFLGDGLESDGDHGGKPYEVEHIEDEVADDDDGGLELEEARVVADLVEIVDELADLEPAPADAGAEEHQQQRKVVERLDEAQQPAGAAEVADGEPADVEERIRELKQQENGSVVLYVGLQADAEHQCRHDRVQHKGQRRVEHRDVDIP